jgi:hypothetical protein
LREGETEGRHELTQISLTTEPWQAATTDEHGFFLTGESRGTERVISDQRSVIGEKRAGIFDFRLRGKRNAEL